MIPVSGVRNCLSRLFGVTVRIFKHAQRKQFRQCAADRPVQSFLCQYKLFFLKPFRYGMSVVIAVASPVISFPAVLMIEEAADQIHPCLIYRKSHPFRPIQHLHAPGHIVYDARIRIDIPLKPHLPAQKSVNKRFIVGKAPGLQFHGIAVFICLGSAFLFRRLCVIGHDGGSPTVCCRLKSRKVVF